MTVVELLDAAPIENIVGTIALKADKIIYVGSISQKSFERKAEIFRKYFCAKGMTDVKFEYVNVIRNDFNDIYTKLYKIAEENPDCYFDVTGGEELVLTALGALCRAREDARLYQVNPNSGGVRVFDFVPDMQEVLTLPDRSTNILNTVDENMLVHGGAVVYDNQIRGATHIWDLNADFVSDIETMWEICCRGVAGRFGNDISGAGCSYPRSWNRLINTVSTLYSLSDESCADNEVCANVVQAAEAMKSGSGYFLPDSYLNAFRSYGLIDDVSVSSYVSLKFKNEQVKRCLTVAGTLLEVKTYLMCKRILGERFNDCLCGVCIDWDGVIHSDGIEDEPYDRPSFVADTKNEIDVMLMRGVIPVFISCKNGRFGSDELYKLNTVCDRFGTKYGRKIIVTTDFEHDNGLFQLMELEQRAKDMKIYIIKDVHKLTDELFEKKLRNAIDGNSFSK